MNPKEIRREKIHQRIHILRIRYDRCIIFSLHSFPSDWQYVWG